ncbi:MAG: tRNA-specific adenosine deaminase [Acidobacteria bacterium]|nr:MAG: tRNA-specific adenosine deaminase [Acidobacteriota bacterium]
MTDEDLMRVALDEAAKAGELGEVPIGCAISAGDAVIARAHNRRETDQDPTAHAEILALRAAAEKLGNWRLEGVTVASTLEPCPMCAGALVASRAGRLIFGAYDPKAGATATLYNLVQDPRLNHEVEVAGGVLGDECSDLLSNFFATLRRSR